MPRKRSTPPPRMTTREVNDILDQRFKLMFGDVYDFDKAPACQFDEGRIGIHCPASGCQERCYTYGKEIK